MSVAFPGLYCPCVFVIVFIKPYIAVKQGGGAVNGGFAIHIMQK